MRQGNNNRRGRHPKKSNQGSVPTRNQVFDSNGPEVRVRGNAHQVFDKYTSLAREATAAGNHVRAEAFWQHAEHYLRLHLASTVMGNQGGGGNRRGGQQNREQFPPEALEDPLIFRPDMPEPQERSEQPREDGEQPQAAAEGEGNNNRRERRPRNEKGERGEKGERRERRERKPRQPREATPAGEAQASVDPSEQDQPEIPLFHAGAEAPEGEAVVESLVPPPAPAPVEPPADEEESA